MGQSSVKAVYSRFHGESGYEHTPIRKCCRFVSLQLQLSSGALSFFLKITLIFCVYVIA